MRGCQHSATGSFRTHQRMRGRYQLSAREAVIISPSEVQVSGFRPSAKPEYGRTPQSADGTYASLRSCEDFINQTSACEVDIAF